MEQSELANLRRLNSEKAERLDEYRMILRDMKALIAAKDAELQKTNYLLTRRERLIKKLGKKVQRLESANAALVALLRKCKNRMERPGGGYGELERHIDAAIKEAGVRE